MKHQQLAPPTTGRYMDLRSDFAFKRIFLAEPRKELLIAFLNELFRGRKIIKDLVYLPQESHGRLLEDRKVIFDLVCTGSDGETFLIEMQRTAQKNFVDRALYYCAHHFVDQGPKGEKHWSYQLKEVYFIGVMDFKLPNSRPGKYFHRAAIMHEETHEILCNKLGFIFLELPNFNLEEKDIKSDLERWFYVLRNLGKLEKIPVILHKRIFQKLFHIAELSQLKKEEYMLYQKDLKDQWDAYNQLQTAREEGFEEGEARGEAKGLAKGLAEGEEKKSREFIENLILKLNLDNQKTADLAGVSVDFVRKVRAGLKKKKSF